VSELAERFDRLDVDEASVAACWIGQSGYLFKGASGRSVLVDPYLSNAAEDLIGVPRLTPSPLSAEDLVPDVLLISHSDLDHLDIPTVRTFAAGNRTFLAAPSTSVTRARARCGWSVDASTALRPGDSCRAHDIEVTASFARHSDADLMTHDSIGFVVEIGEMVIWHAGDTEYDARLRSASSKTIDLALLPINGTGGNMNAHEAALLAWQVGARVVMPMHYGMWADEDYTYQGLEPGATLDPRTFEDTYRRLGGQGRVVLPEVGEIVLLRRDADGGVTLGGGTATE
jgi:L-ascorbate 6-phosphate lactonase